MPQEGCPNQQFIQILGHALRCYLPCPACYIVGFPAILLMNIVSLCTYLLQQFVAQLVISKKSHSFKVDSICFEPHLS
eukprot:5533791-Amphidinium_carterae.1